MIPVTRLADVLQVPDDEAPAIVAALALAGMLESWDDSPDGPAVILSSMAAARIGVELAAADDASPASKTGTRTLRWIRAAKVRNEKAATDAVPFTDLFGPSDGKGEDGDQRGVKGVADPLAIDPAVAAERAEGAKPPGNVDRGWAKRLEGAVWATKIRITQVLGLRLAWPAKCVSGEPCPGCHSRRLGLHEVCVVEGCDRAGVDPWLPAVAASERPKPYAPDDGVAGGRGAATATRSFTAAMTAVEKETIKRRKQAARRAGKKTGKRRRAS